MPDKQVKKKVFLGIIVIQYSLVAEVFETQDDLQGWTEAFNEDSKVNVQGKFLNWTNYLVEIADGLRPLFNPMDSHESMAPEIRTVWDLLGSRDSSRGNCFIKPQTSSLYFKAQCFKPCAVNLLSSASEGVVANEEKD